MFFRTCPASAFLVILTLLIATGCSRTPERPFERVAFVPFENLSPDSRATWMGAAVAGIAAAQTEGDSKIRTFDVSALREAWALRADRIVTGYITSFDGKLTAHGSIRDEQTLKTVRAFAISAAESDIVALATGVARETGAPVRDWYTHNAAAIRAYFEARSVQSPADAIALLDKAITADPSFGAAHVTRIELLTRSGNRDAALASLPAVEQLKLSDSDRARLELAAAQAKDDASGQVAALTTLARIQGANPQAWRSVAEGQMLLKDYRAAAEAAGHVLDLEPRDEAMLNLRGYALGFAGDLPGARHAFEQYRTSYPDSANPIDSLGEVLFYHRQYEEAGKLFLEAGAKDPQALNGAEPFRAALCRVLLKDIAGADKLFRQYIEVRQQAHDPLVALREAIWKRMTGRAAQAPDDALGLATNALWAVADGDRNRARTMAETARRAAVSPAEVALASTAWLLAQPSAPAQAWESRIAAALPGTQQSKARSQLLGWALLLDRHSADAVGIWRSEWQSSSALTGNEARMLLTWSLVEAGQMEEAKKTMPYGWMPPTGPEPGLNVLFYPKIPNIRTRF